MATKLNLVIDQGATFSASFNLAESGEEIDLSQYTGRSQLRRFYTSNAEVDFTVTMLESTVTLSLSDELTSDLCPGRYYYDVELVRTSGNTVSRVVEGLVTVTPCVTR